MERALLERYVPASVLVDRHFQVQYLRGPTEDYLRPPAGEPSYNLIAMARQGLQTTLRATVRKAVKTGQEVTAESRVRRDGALHPVRVVVAPLGSAREAEARLLVTFLERESKPEAAHPPRSKTRRRKVSCKRSWTPPAKTCGSRWRRWRPRTRS